MPRWRALPDELDPQVREFAGQLRRLVDRGGLSIAAVADRTGYSKTSWERYLNGRLLAPKGAIVALAEVTGTDPVHLTTMWELAERAWSRSEMRHDMTMEAIRISQARAALGETGGQSTVKGGGRNGRAGRSATAMPGVAGPAGVSPTVPPQPRSPSDRISRSPYGGSSAPSTSSPSAPSVSSSSSSSSASPYGGVGGVGGAGSIAGGASRVSWGATPPTSPSGSSPSASSSSPSGLVGGRSSSASSGASTLLAFGDPDAVIVGDFWFPHLVANALTGQRRSSDEEMLEHLAPYVGQRARAQLILVGLGSYARRAPRRRPRDFARS